MINQTIILIGVFIAGVVVMYFKDKIKKYLDKKNVTKTEEELFQWTKMRVGMLSLFSPVQWAKDIASLFNVRKLIIYVVIIGCIFAYGVYKGHQNTPVQVDIGYGKEVMIELLNNTFLHITKNGLMQIEDKNGKVLKQITIKDLPNLQKALSPVGFQLKPIAVMGAGYGSVDGGAIEGGAGVSFFRFWKGRLDTFATNKGIYLGASYKLEILNMENSAIGIAGGKGYEDFPNDNRVIIYWRTEF